MRRNWQTALGLVWMAALLSGWGSPSGAESDPASSGGAPPDQQANALQEVQASPKPANHIDDAHAAYRAGDYATALRISRALAEQGDAAAQAMLGLMYAEGRGVAKDDAEAVKWYRKAADQGLAVAQYNLGLHCAQGRGIEKDDAEAVKWYRKAAEGGNAKAGKYLGDMYARGLGVPVDLRDAEKWYRKAREQGDREAALTRELAEQEGKNGADQIHRVGGDVAAPKLLKRVEAAYPKAARRELIEGVVILDAVIDASGNVTDIAVLKSVHPLIDEAAVHAVRQWRYSPATLNGNPIRVYLTVTITFNLGLSPPWPPRPRGSVFGNWQVPGQRIWIWIGQENRAYQCRITAADVVSTAAGVVEQTPEGKIIRWQSDWPSCSVRRDGDALLLTSSEGSFRLSPLDHKMAPSCARSEVAEPAASADTLRARAAEPQDVRRSIRGVSCHGWTSGVKATDKARRKRLGDIRGSPEHRG